MGKYQNKFRISTSRAPFWNYGWNAAYYITICTKNRVCWFGAVIDKKMDLSAMGHIANSCWHQIPNHFPFVRLGEHIIMPDHLHGIIVIDKSGGGNKPIMTSPKKPNNKFGPQSKNLASIVRGFKTGVTKNVRQIDPDFEWQPRYDDRIIRNEQSFENITKYIIDNPLNWKNYKS